jgi:hypothetical protein
MFTCSFIDSSLYKNRTSRFLPVAHLAKDHVNVCHHFASVVCNLFVISAISTTLDLPFHLRDISKCHNLSYFGRKRDVLFLYKLESMKLHVNIFLKKAQTYLYVWTFYSALHGSRAVSLTPVCIKTGRHAFCQNNWDYDILIYLANGMANPV